MVVFYFYGRIIPERVAFEIAYPKSLTIKNPDNNLVATLIISIHASQINVKVDSNKDYNIIDLKNIVKFSVETISDVFAAFLNGYGYNIEIVSGFKEGESPIVFGVDFNQVNEQIKELLKQNGEEKLNTDEILPFVLTGTIESHLFSKAVKDLRNAINYEDDTGFFSYRAIEHIREVFYQPEDGECNANSWSRLRNKLNIERVYIDEVRKYRVKQAHGRSVPMTSDERADAIIMAWNIVYRFYRYLKNGKEDLKEPDFPLLK